MSVRPSRKFRPEMFDCAAVLHKKSSLLPPKKRINPEKGRINRIKVITLRIIVRIMRACDTPAHSVCARARRPSRVPQPELTIKKRSSKELQYA